jgi:hypothetical protein
MLIQFNARPGMPHFDGPGGHWKRDEVKEIDEHTAQRLLGLYQSPFMVAGGEKAIHAPENKMIGQAPETKESVLHVDGHNRPIIKVDPALTQQKGESKSQFKKRLKEQERRNG